MVWNDAIYAKCLDLVIPLGEPHFRRTLAEFVVYYHRERNRQGLGNELIDSVEQGNPSGTRSPAATLAGFLSYCHRAA
jgi:hypothetical protein